MGGWLMKFNFLLVLFLFSFIVLPVAAIPTSICWSSITCNGTEVYSGTILDSDAVCQINELNPAIATEGVLDIEILQPGYGGATLSQSIFVDQNFIEGQGDSIYFILSKGTSPVYINCYDVNSHLRTTSLDHFVLARNNLSDTNILVNYRNSLAVNSTLTVDSNIPISKNYYIFEDPNYKYPLGILFIILGALLFFATFVNNSIKEFI